MGDLARNGKPTMTEIQARYEANVVAIRERLPRTDLVLTTSAPAGGKYTHLNPLILEWNAFVRETAKRHKLILVDDHPKLVDEAGNLRADLSDDGLHLNDAGHVILYKALLDGLAQTKAATKAAAKPAATP